MVCVDLGQVRLYITVSVKLAAGWVLPSVPITETVEVVSGRTVSTPQPVHRLSPTARQASRNICAPRRLFQPKQQNTSARADPGNEGPELRSRATFVAEAVVTVNVADATVPEGVTGVGENLHDAPEFCLFH